MSPRVAVETEGGGGRIAVTVVLVLGVTIAMLLLVRSQPDVAPFDPRSSRADGARALVLLLEQQGATVDIGHAVPARGEDTRVLVLSDHLDDAQRAELLAFVESGGIAIVADPASSLHGGPGLDGGSVAIVATSPPVAVEASDDDGDVAAEGEANIGRGACTIAALEHLRGLFVPDGVLYPIGTGDESCFSAASTDAAATHAFVFRNRMGGGSVIGLGDNQIFTNEFIRFADNSGLGVALLAPHATRVTIVLGDDVARTPADIGTGDETLRDLVRPGVWMALSQLALAFVVFAFARGVRSGRTIEELAPAPIAGSELVRARGRVMHRAQHASRAGEILRADLRRTLCAQFAMPPSADDAGLVAEAVRRSAVDGAQLTAVLTREVADAEQLLELSRQIATVRATIAVQPDQQPHAHSDRTPTSKDLSHDR
jgi:hypothetical protein